MKTSSRWHQDQATVDEIAPTASQSSQWGGASQAPSRNAGRSKAFDGRRMEASEPYHQGVYNEPSNRYFYLISTWDTQPLHDCGCACSRRDGMVCVVFAVVGPGRVTWNCWSDTYYSIVRGNWDDCVLEALDDIRFLEDPGDPTLRLTQYLIAFRSQAIDYFAPSLVGKKEVNGGLPLTHTARK